MFGLVLFAQQPTTRWGIPPITPTLRVFIHGVPTEYELPRTTDMLVKWAQAKAQPLWTEKFKPKTHRDLVGNFGAVQN